LNLQKKVNEERMELKEKEIRAILDREHALSEQHALL